MSKKGILSAALFFFFVAAAIASGTYYHVQSQIKAPLVAGSAEEKEFAVQKGESVKDISTNLEKEGLIRGAGYFQVYVWQEKVAEKIQAGKYQLSPSMSIPEIADILMGGKIKNEDVWVTIPEGFMVSDIDRRLAENGLIKEGEFVRMDGDLKMDLSQYVFLAGRPEGSGLEGFYFPDTYKYKKGVSVEDIARKMLDNFGRKLSESLQKEIGRQNKTVYETIVLASIIEKEAGSAKDMKKVSSVFHNRLVLGMKLESDATVNYVIRKGRSQATYEDLEINSPFNTYMYAGLPPGPISNPGLDAIIAAIYPDSTDYYYFLTRRDNDQAVFSKTFDEHILNKNRYLK
ncbi:MAG: endolytic transglycosylase MltG [Candidatus Paceibacterota bacterium]|jgi:UPF0755 protein